MATAPYKFEGLKEYLRFFKESDLSPEVFHAVFGPYNAKKGNKNPKAKEIRQKLFKFRYQEEIDHENKSSETERAAFSVFTPDCRSVGSCVGTGRQRRAGYGYERLLSL